jgi:hypothetical protein
MKKCLLALVLTQIAAAVVAHAVSEKWAWLIQLGLGLTVGVLWTVGALRYVSQRHPAAPPVCGPAAGAAGIEPPDPQAEYHRDCVAWAEGRLSWEELLDRWAGRVPPSPRAARRRRREDAEIALFKEVMSPGFADPPRPRFRRGQWVRDYGRLGKVRRAKWFPGPTWSYEVEFSDEIADVHESCLDSVTCPSTWEWWAWLPCVVHTPAGAAWAERPQRVPPSTDPARNPELESAAVACGCLHPVNFGRGRDL